MGIPGLREGYAVLDDERPQAVQFMGAKTVRLRKVYRI